MIRRSRLLLLVLALAGCSRELDVPGLEGGPGADPCAGRLLAVTVSPALARVGDELTLSFTANAASGTLSVRVGQGAPAPVTSPPVSNAYTQRYTVRGDEYAAAPTLPAGEDAQVQVTLQDGALTCTATTAADAPVRLDFEPPSIEGMVGVAPEPAGPGAPVTISFTAAEQLLVPTGSLFGGPLSCSPGATPRSFACSSTADASDVEGPNDAALLLVDLAGNETPIDLPGLVTLDLHDRTRPVISALSVAPPRATLGTELSIRFTVDRTLAGEPAVLVSGLPALLVGSAPGSAVGSVDYSFSSAVTAALPEGDATVQVTVLDLLGRSSSETTGAFFDFTPPSVLSLVATPSTAGVGARLVLEITASEALESLAATLDGAGPLACAPTVDPERFTCERTVLRTDPAGVLSATLDLVDEAGLTAHVLFPAAATLDLTCGLDRSKVFLVRGTARGATLEATTGAFEADAAVRVYADAFDVTPLVEGVAGADGSLAPLSLPVDAPDATFDAVTATTCARQLPRHRFVATLAGKVPFQPVPNPASAFTAAATSLAPDPAAILRGRELFQAEYDGASAIDGARATFTLPAATSRDVSLLTAGSWNCACARGSPAFGFDEARGEAVLFGGDPPGSPCGRSPDLWIFNPLFGWVEQLPGSSPPPVTLAATAYDSVRRRLVLFGGDVAGIPTRALWEWDGLNWSSPPITGPSGRQQHALAHDSARGVTVLFGGVDDTGAVLADTWEYDGQSWSQAVPGSSPPARARHGLAYDEARGVTVLFGGTSAVGPTFDDVWEWDGTDWIEVTPAAGGPGPVNDPAMAYNPELRRTLLVGDGALWEWDGQRFTQGTFGNHPALASLPGTRVRLARADALGKTLLLDASGAGVPGGCNTGMDLFGISAPPDRPAVLVRFELAGLGFVPTSLTASATATGEGPAGAGQPGARLAVLDLGTGSFAPFAENAATEADPAPDRTLSLSLAAPLDGRYLAGGQLQLLLLSPLPITDQGGSTLSIDAVEVVAGD